MPQAKVIACALLSILFANPAYAQDLRNVRVGIPTLSPIIASTLVPRDQGYFKQEGLDVETIVIRSARRCRLSRQKKLTFS